MTFDEQVEQVIAWFNEAPKVEQERFKNTSKDDLCLFHHTLGRSIRNNLKLWEVKWEEEVVDGVDVSTNHPDAISMRIIEAVWAKVRNTYNRPPNPPTCSHGAPMDAGCKECGRGRPVS